MLREGAVVKMTLDGEEIEVHILAKTDRGYRVELLSPSLDASVFTVVPFDQLEHAVAEGRWLAA